MCVRSQGEGWMGPSIHTDYKYSAHGEAKIDRKYLHPSLAGNATSPGARILLHAEEKLAAWTGVRWDGVKILQ